MTETQPAPAAFPSTFAKNRRAEERAAAAQEAQQVQRAAVTQPGRAVAKGKGKSKKGLWEDSDEEDEAEEDDDDEDDEDDGPRGSPSPHAHAQRPNSAYDPTTSPTSTPPRGST